MQIAVRDELTSGAVMQATKQRG